MAELSYPFDPTGIAPSNLIPNEVHTVTEANYRDYHFIVPEFAPFFEDNFKLQLITTTEGIIDLVPDRDYAFALEYVAATRSIGKSIYGAVTISSQNITGTVLVSYQTLGGEWTASRTFVLNRIAEKIYNPRTTIWDVITDKPTQFPPINHNQLFDYVYGQKELIDAINALAIKAGEEPLQNLFTRHILEVGNVHSLTLDDLNLSIATPEEVLAGGNSSQLVTASTLMSVINTLKTNGTI